jgi:hypothetical protein
MKKKIYWILLGLCVLGLPYLVEYQSYYTQFNPWARFDFSRLCSLSEHLLKNEPDPIKREFVFYKTLRRGFYSPSTKNIIAFLNGVNSENRLPSFQQGMREIGFSHYQCESLMVILNVRQ